MTAMAAGAVHAASMPARPDPANLPTTLRSEPPETVALTIAGTQPYGWSSLAERLAQTLGRHAELRIADDLVDLGALPEGARCIVFVESPVRALSRWVAVGDGTSARTTLEAWSDSARPLMRRAQTAPAATLVIDVAEAFAHPAALARSVARWCALPAPSAMLPALPQQRDTLCDTLAAYLCAQDPASLALFDELHASSAVLEGATPIDDPAMSFGDLGGRAIARCRELMARERELERLPPQLEGLRADLQAVRKKFAIQAAEIGALKGAKARSDALATGQSADADFLLSRMVELQAALETEHGEAERQTALATAAANESGALRALLEQRTAESRSLLERHAEADASAARLRTDLEALQRRLREQAQAAGVLERERTELLAAMAWYTGLQRRAGTAIPSLRLLHAQEDPPHRHLHFAVDAMQIEGQATPAAEIRLVEHHGHPGMAIFALGKRTFISAWQPHGREDARSFMLFVPNDHAGEQALQRLGTTDWVRLRHVAMLLAQHLQGSAAPDGWCETAQRLVAQLQGLPARLRYDDVRTVTDVGDPRSIVLTFDGAAYGDRVLGSVQLHWDSPQGLLRWRRDGGVPLSAWPVGSDGTLAEHFVLPVNHASAWRASPAADRRLLLALLEALPGVLAQGPDPAVPADPARREWVAAAIRVHRRARRAEWSRVWRSMLRRLLHRPPQH